MSTLTQFIAPRRRQGYNTTGEVHHAGVANEGHTVNICNSSIPSNLQENYPGQTLTFRKEGGTHQVSDMGIYADDVRVAGGSDKLHRSGTFDHVNTSKVNEYLPCESLIKMIDDLRSAHRGDSSAITTVKTAIKDATNDTWNGMTSEGIRKLLVTVNQRTPEWMFVREKTELSVFHHSEMRELSEFPYDPTWTYVLRAGRAKESRQVWREKDGLGVNTHLRLRLVTNNGVTALLGLSEANKNSILTLKIQQDAVAALLNAVKRVRIAIA
jgi:hypothetical protein